VNKIIIVGGAKLSNNLSGYIDSFDRVCRINFVLPSGNNGTRLDIQFVNWHIYNKLHKDRDWKSAEKWYVPVTIPKKEYLYEYIRHIEENKFNEVVEHYEIDKCDVSNSILEKINCPYRFDKQPRTGYQAILYYIENGYDVSAVGFSLDIETNTASYAPNKPLKPAQHGYENEFKIMKWLYTNKVIGGLENNEVN
tara:strand:+ start:875 stop:1459 length:585 start_codon:yes stop_codon:yes gene_type:complete